MSNSIAVIGTRGAGKTVFVTVLANYLSTPKDGVLLIPDSYEVGAYVKLNYAKLQRGEWLDSTNKEQKLSWKLRAPNLQEQRLTLLDCAGEDLQRLFVERDFENTDADSDKRIVDFLLGASTVLLLINLQDFLETSHEEAVVSRQQQREYTLKEFLTAIKKDASRHIAVVFTAYNQYQERIKREYANVDNFLAKKLPSLYYEHFHGNDTTAFLVSAVADTDIDKNPKRGFTHQGLGRVIQWLVEPAQYKNRNERQQEKERQVQEEQEKSVNEPRMYEW